MKVMVNDGGEAGPCLGEDPSMGRSRSRWSGCWREASEKGARAPDSDEPGRRRGRGDSAEQDNRMSAHGAQPCARVRVWRKVRVMFVIIWVVGAVPAETAVISTAGAARTARCPGGRRGTAQNDRA